MNVQEFTKHATCALALIRTFGGKQQKQLKLVVMKTEFIESCRVFCGTPVGKYSWPWDGLGPGTRLLGSPGLF